MILSAPLSPALGFGGPVLSQAVVVGSPPASPNPNLLLWSEALDNLVWAASGAVVTANAANDPDGQPTAEHVTLDPEGTLEQTTTVAVTTGAAAGGTHAATTTLQRFAVTGTFDGTVYKFSCYARSAGSVSFSMTLFRFGGFIVARLSNPDDLEGIEFDVAWAKLETPTLTAYVKREGS